jgi:uncharacterized Tic20 family protein
VRFYINRGGNTEGPHDEQAIIGMITRGELDRQAYICAEGAQAWQGLDSHPPFASALAGPAQPQAFAPQPQPQAFAPQPQPQAFAPQPQPQAFAPQPQAFAPQPQAFAPQPQAFDAQPQPQAFGAQPQAFAAHPQPQGFGGQPQPTFEAQAGQAANQAAHQLGNAANAFGSALGNSAAAPGSGYFEQVKAQNQPIPESAKAAAGQAHLFAALGLLLTCGTWGGVVGAFVAYALYKDQPKHPFAVYHVNQAMVFHSATVVLMMTVAAIVNVLIRIGANIADVLGLALSALYLVNLAIWGVAILLTFKQRTQAMNGEWSEYPKAGKYVMGRTKPFLS